MHIPGSSGSSATGSRKSKENSKTSQLESCSVLHLVEETDSTEVDGDMQQI